MKKMHLFFVLFSIIACCAKDPLEPPPPPLPPCEEECDTSVLKLIWKAPVGADTAEYFSGQPVLKNNNVLITKMFGGPHDILAFRNGLSGALIWNWDNPQDIDDGGSIGGVEALKIFENKLAVCSWHEINVVDLNTGTLTWRSDVNDKGGCGWPRMSLINDYIYHVHEPCGVKDSSVSLVRSSVHFPKWDTLLTMHVDNGFFPSIEPVSLWINGSGDSVLIFQNRSTKFASVNNGGGGRVDLIAFSLKTREIVWRKDSIDSGSCVRPPLVYEGRVYFCGGYTLFCFDPASGDVLWKKQYPAHLLNTDLLIAEGKLVVHPNDASIYAYDPASGAELWKQTNSGASPTDMEYYKGHIFFASAGYDGIYIHRLSDGQLVKRLRSPNRSKYSNAMFTRPIAINPENGYLYCTDGFFAMCYEIKL